jgi:hypothetical protein
MPRAAPDTREVTLAEARMELNWYSQHVLLPDLMSLQSHVPMRIRLFQQVAPIAYVASAILSDVRTFNVNRPLHLEHARTAAWPPLHSEEFGLPYTAHPININKDEQFTP